jgi:putative peptidoglycan lipid II flippase
MHLYREQVSKTMRTTLYLSVPASALMLALAPQIVNLAYGYGKAANQANLGHIAMSLQVFALAIWAWCVQPILMRGFFSIHETAKPVIIGTIMTALFIAMCYVTQHTPIGFLAIPACTNVAAILLVFVLFIALEKRVGALDRAGIVATFLKSAIASAVMAGVAYGAFQFIPHDLHKIPMFLTFMFVCCIVGWIYFFITRALKMPETDYLARAFNRMQRKRG